MRFLLDQNGSDPGLHDVITISEMSAVPVYTPGRKIGDKPIDIFVYIYDINNDVEDGLEGQYNLDGTEETYRKAVENYNKISEQLLKLGYARMSDFENFTWED